MSLTAARGPFGKDPAGRLNFTPDPPTGSVLLWDPVPYRLRAIVAGECVLDTANAKLLHETGLPPVSICFYDEHVDVEVDGGPT